MTSLTKYARCSSGSQSRRLGGSRKSWSGRYGRKGIKHYAPTLFADAREIVILGRAPSQGASIPNGQPSFPRQYFTLGSPTTIQVSVSTTGISPGVYPCSVFLYAANDPSVL